MILPTILFRFVCSFFICLNKQNVKKDVLRFSFTFNIQRIYIHFKIHVQNTLILLIPVAKTCEKAIGLT